MELFKILGTVAVDVEDAKKNLDDVTQKAEKTGSNLGSSFQKAGRITQTAGAALLPVTAALGGIAVASGKASISFEDAMAKVSTIADTTQVPIEEMEAAILKLSNETGIAANDIADNVYNAISAGQETADAVAFVEKATKLATAGFTDSNSALDVLTTTLNAYGMEAKDVTKVSDMLIQTQNMGKTTVGELAGYMGKVIPTAKGANVALEQVTTAYAKLTANGIQTADSTTYLNSMLNELNKSGTNVSKIIIEKTGKSFSELMAEGKSLADVLAIVDEGAQESGKSFSDVWSSAEAGKAASVIHDNTNKLGDFNKAVEDMKKASQDNATEVAFEKMQTTSYNLQKTLNELKNTAIELGNTIMETLAPYIEQISDKIHKACEWFSNLDDAQKKTIVTIGAVIAALGPALIVTGKLMSSLGSIISVASKLGSILPEIATAVGGITLPVLAVVAVIAVLVAAFVHLWKTNEDFRNNITAIWERLKTTFEEFGQGIVDRLNDMGFQFENISEVIRAAWEGLCNFLAPIFEGAFGQIVNAFSFALNTILNYFDLFKAVFTGDWQGAFDAVKNIVTTALDFIKNTFQTWFNAFDSLTNGKLTAFKDKVVSIFETVKQKIGSALDWIKSKFEALQLKFPNIKLPHFSIKGEWSFNPPSVPHFAVDWYAKAMDNPMIMNSPTAFGINANGQVMAGGEAGSEVVSGTNTLMNMISSSVSAQNKVLEDKLQSILSMMAEYMPQMANMQMVIDSGALVGQIAPSMDVALGTMQIRAGRGAI